MRRDFFSSSVGEISGWDEWNLRERPTALERARQKAKDTISSHAAPPLPDDVVRQIRDVFPDIVIDLTSPQIE
jgi:trimethylamine:corrinoid methyltransferase-like protein